jgi:cell division protein FtsI/penicillin-binding protein 2
MLVTVVDTSLLGGTVKVGTMSVAAKTGTAQISAPSGGYYDDRYLHSFFGYFPAYEPRFIIFLFTVEPKGVRYASETLTHPFMHLVSSLSNYYELPPDRNTSESEDDTL